VGGQQDEAAKGMSPRPLTCWTRPGWRERARDRIHSGSKNGGSGSEDRVAFSESPP
jgi:hypothetical protein